VVVLGQSQISSGFLPINGLGGSPGAVIGMSWGPCAGMRHPA
jgi:hypothetical protein